VTSLATALDGSVKTRVCGSVCQVVALAVGGHPEVDLPWRSSFGDVVLHGGVNVVFSQQSVVVLRLVQVGVVTGGGVPGTVEVIRHQVDEVHGLRDFVQLIGSIHFVSSCRGGDRQEQGRLARLGGFGVKCLTEFLTKQRESPLVLWRTAPGRGTPSQCQGRQSCDSSGS